MVHENGEYLILNAFEVKALAEGKRIEALGVGIDLTNPRKKGINLYLEDRRISFFVGL